MKKKIELLLCLLVVGAALLGTNAAYATESGETQTEETAAAEETTAEEETTAAAKKKKTKKGNMDKYVGLSNDYRVVATAKKKTKVYQKASTSSKVLGSFKKNNCVILNTKSLKKGTTYKWLKIKMPNKKVGYVQKSYVKLDVLNVKNWGLSTKTKKNRQRIKICSYAFPHIGTRFVMGGNSLTNGIDCSTLVRRAVRSAGVYTVGASDLAENLSNRGKAIKRSQLKPGDLVFYYNSASDHRIGHSAIYIGKGYIINSSGKQGHNYPSGGIRISKIDYRKPTAVKFRNVVGN